MRVSILLLFVGGLNLPLVHAQTQMNVHGNLLPGAYDVGTKQLAFANSSGDRENNRIQINLWYPAEEVSNRLKLSDYLQYRKALSDTELLTELSIGISGKASMISNDSLTLILNASMRAARDVTLSPGKFPLLIWSMRYRTVEHQHIISEYLASHGYVVAFAEDIPNSPYPWEIQDTDEKADKLNQHVQDINTSIEYLLAQPFIDDQKVGLLSWSYSGESAILSQMSNPSINLVVGLSSLGFSSGVYLGPELEKTIDMKKLNVPYLILTQRLRGNGSVFTPPEFFGQMHPNSRFVSFGGLAHGNFNAMEGMLPGLLRTNNVQSWSIGGKVAQLGYEAICEVTLSFINTVFSERSFEAFDEKTSQLKGRWPHELSTESPSGN